MITMIPDASTTFMAQEAERRRLARELHDGVVQSLTALVADLEYFRTRRLPAEGTSQPEVAEKLEVWQELARDSLLLMRQALGGLRKNTELEVGLEAAIASLLTEFQQAGYKVIYDCSDWPQTLPDEYTSNVYFIVREALTNIRKHAQATKISVFLFKHGRHLHVSIGDNGAGMPASWATVSAPGYRQGLVGLRERAAMLGGQLTIESTAGRGTRIDVDIALPEKSVVN